MIVLGKMIQRGWVVTYTLFLFNHSYIALRMKFHIPFPLIQSSPGCIPVVTGSPISTERSDP